MTLKKPWNKFNLAPYARHVSATAAFGLHQTRYAVNSNVYRKAPLTGKPALTGQITFTGKPALIGKSRRWRKNLY